MRGLFFSGEIKRTVPFNFSDRQAEDVYVKNYESVKDAYDNLAKYFQLYNRERLHESLGYRTQHEVYFGNNKTNDGDAFRLIHQIQPIFVS